MTHCLCFIKTFYDHKKRYRFYAGVKYAIKNIDNNYYYTVKGVKLPKSYENRIYTVNRYR